MLLGQVNGCPSPLRQEYLRDVAEKRSGCTYRFSKAFVVNHEFFVMLPRRNVVIRDSMEDLAIDLSL